MICDLFFCYCGFCSFVYAFNCVLWVDLSFVFEGWMCLFWQSLEKGSPVEIGVIFLLGIVYMLLKLCCVLISGYCWSHKFFLDFSSFFFRAKPKLTQHGKQSKFRRICLVCWRGHVLVLLWWHFGRSFMCVHFSVPTWEAVKILIVGFFFPLFTNLCIYQRLVFLCQGWVCLFCYLLEKALCWKRCAWGCSAWGLQLIYFELLMTLVMIRNGD